MARKRLKIDGSKDKADKMGILLFTSDFNRNQSKFLTRIEHNLKEIDKLIEQKPERRSYNRGCKLKNWNFGNLKPKLPQTISDFY